MRTFHLTFIYLPSPYCQLSCNMGLCNNYLRTNKIFIKPIILAKKRLTDVGPTHSRTKATKLNFQFSNSNFFSFLTKSVFLFNSLFFDVSFFPLRIFFGEVEEHYVFFRKFEATPENIQILWKKN